MASTPRRRIINPKYSSSSPSVSSPIQTLSSIEPPRSLFPSTKEFLNLLTVVYIAASVAIACNYAVTFFNRQPKPFCNSDAEFDYYLSDTCDPCPNHGICTEGKLECMSGYRRHGRSCVEDGDINEMAKNLVRTKNALTLLEGLKLLNEAKMVESRACESYSKYLCKGVGKAWVQGDELWNDMDKDNATHLYAKQKATEIVGNLLEIRHTDTGIEELKCPDFLVERYKPMSCCIRLWVLEHALFLVPCCVLLVGVVLTLQRIQRRHYLSARAEELYEQVCDILEDKALTSRNVNGEGEPWIVASWLRDDILTPKERRDPVLWKKVEELVQEDSRLDRYPKLLKGEPKIVWEWQVEGSLRSSGKKNKDSLNKHKSSEEAKLGSNQDQRRRLKHGERVKC